MSSWGDGPVQVRLTIGQSTLTQADIRSFEHRAACCDGDLGLGQVCAASISAELAGARDLLGESITAELGESSGGTLTWHDLGSFVVSECQRGEDSTTITAQDAAWYALAGEYVPTVSSPTSAINVLADLANQAGLDVESETLNIALGSDVEAALAGYSCRAMLGYLAALCGYNCLISRAGEIRFVWFEDGGEELDADRTLAGTYRYGGTSTLLGLKCTVPDGDTSATLTAGNADKAIDIQCPYMTQSRLSALWTALGGYEWPVLEVSCYGGAEIQPGDIVAVEDAAGNSLDVPVMEVSLNIDGGCRCTLRSFGKGDTARAADAVGPRELRLREVEHTAGVAMQSASGKNKVFHQASAPAASAGLTAGDLWFDTAHGNRMSTWDGTAWGSFTLRNEAVSSLDAGAITTGTLSAARIDVTGVFALDITATGSITGATLTTGDYFSVDSDGHLTASNGEIDTCYVSDLLFKVQYLAMYVDETEYMWENLLYRLSAGENGYSIDAELLPRYGHWVDVYEPPEDLSDVDPQEAAQSSEGTVNLARFLINRNAGSAHAYLPNVEASGDLDVAGDGSVGGGLGVSGDVDTAGSYKRNGNALLAGYAATERLQLSASCAAGSSGTDSISVAKTGYTPIAVAGYELAGGGADVNLYRLHLYGSTLHWGLRNFGSSAFSGHLYVNILYLAD